MDPKLLLATLALPLTGWLCYRFRHRRKLSNGWLLVFTVLLVLDTSEWIYRKFYLTDPGTFSTVNNYYVPDSVVGFHFKPGQIPALEYVWGGDTLYNTYYTIIPDTNQQGSNYPARKAFRSDTAQTEVVFLGCSFTFGEGLADEETLPWQFGQLTGLSTVNRACNGLGVHQVYQLFKTEYARQDNRHRIFVYSFFAEHFFRALGFYSWNLAGPDYSLEGDSLVTSGPIYPRRSSPGHRLARAASLLGTFNLVGDRLESFFLIRAKRRLTEKRLAPFYRMFQEMTRIAGETGGQFVVLDWDGVTEKTGSPVLDADLASGKLQDIVTANHGRYLMVKDTLDRSTPGNYIPRDGHPTGKANGILAAYIARSLGMH